MANFQQIFNEMKAENPTASLGAVQHMTVMKLSEIRDQKVEEEKLRELGSGRNNLATEGRYNSIAAKTMNKFVDAIRVVASDEGEVPKKSWNKSSLNESYGSTSTNGEGTRGEGLLSFQSFRRRSTVNSALPRRRVSQDSAGAHTFSDFNASNDSLLIGSNENCARARTANEMYAIAANEQGANMAPRKSVGDFTAMLSVADLSDDRCGDSIKSDLSGLILEELARSARSLELELNDKNGGDEDVSLQESDRDVLEAFTLSIGESVKPYDPETNNSQNEAANDTHQWIETQFEKPESRFAAPISMPNDDSCELNRSRHSDTKSAVSGLSGYSDCTSACSDGLIVGFRPRNCSETSRDEDHLNAGNFASDFSAWDRRR